MSYLLNILLLCGVGVIPVPSKQWAEITETVSGSKTMYWAESDDRCLCVYAIKEGDAILARRLTYELDEDGARYPSFDMMVEKTEAATLFSELQNAYQKTSGQFDESPLAG